MIAIIALILMIINCVLAFSVSKIIGVITVFVNIMLLLGFGAVICFVINAVALIILAFKAAND